MKNTNIFKLFANEVGPFISTDVRSSLYEVLESLQEAYNPVNVYSPDEMSEAALNVFKKYVSFVSYFSNTLILKPESSDLFMGAFNNTEKLTSGSPKSIAEVNYVSDLLNMVSHIIIDLGANLNRNHNGKANKDDQKSWWSGIENLAKYMGHFMALAFTDIESLEYKYKENQ